MNWSDLVSIWQSLESQILDILSLFTQPLEVVLNDILVTDSNLLNFIYDLILSVVPNSYSLLQIMIVLFGSFIIPYTLIKWVIDLVL